MSIQSLSASTIRIIGSSQVLTDPTSVVKELVDNALDARATSIFVELSANALDVIQVRDNGNGIAPEDRDMVCRRYCTSKIRDYSDLKNVGGKWLGFRGEALSSAAELSGTMTLTTKIEGEDVAVTLKIKTNGEVEGRDRASHPVGTTVRLTDLFSPIPVRRQSALKISAKTLLKTKRMLQSYALARPHVRFSLRILKAKNDKCNWTYAPKPDAGIEDAAFKVVGQDCASQCEWMVMERNGFEVQAFLPKRDADISKISHIGHFVSIDSRPVSTARGTTKQMMTAFKEKLRAAHAAANNAKDIFIWLNIVCPPQSYDPNIEPAKDDVMFEDKDKVIEAVNALFDECYPARAFHETEQAIPDSIEIFEDPIVDDVEELAQKQRPSKSNMYQGNDDDNVTLERLEFPSESDAHDNEVQSAAGVRDITISNPWIIAKMNTSVRPRRTGSVRNGQLLTPLRERNDSDVNSASRTIPACYPLHSPWNPSSPQTWSPIRGTNVQNNPQTYANERSSISIPSQTEERILRTETDPSRDAEEEAQYHVSAQRMPQARYTGWTAINDFIPARQLPLEPPADSSLETPAPQIRAAKRQHYLHAAAASAASRVQNPLVSSVHDENNVWFDHIPPSYNNSQKRVAGKKRKQDHTQDLDIREAFSATETSSSEIYGFHRRQRREGYVESPAELGEDNVEVGMEATHLRRRQRLDDGSADANPCIRTFMHASEPDIVEPPPPAPQLINHSPKSYFPNITANNTLQVLDPNPDHTNPPPAQPNPPRNPSRHLSRTSQLPLERIPAHANLHNVRHKTTITIQDLTDLTADLQLVERECHDILAPIWGFPAECDIEDPDGSGDDDTDADDDINDDSANDDDDNDDQNDNGNGNRQTPSPKQTLKPKPKPRTSMTHPPPTKQEIASWEAQLRFFAHGKGWRGGGVDLMY